METNRTFQIHLNKNYGPKLTKHCQFVYLFFSVSPIGCAIEQRGDADSISQQQTNYIWKWILIERWTILSYYLWPNNSTIFRACCQLWLLAHTRHCHWWCFHSTECEQFDRCLLYLFNFSIFFPYNMLMHSWARCPHNNAKQSNKIFVKCLQKSTVIGFVMFRIFRDFSLKKMSMKKSVRLSMLWMLSHSLLSLNCFWCSLPIVE